ncbi:uncharacterized protein LOC118503345 [Anopheles stephensi]|uniref:uncharacterized protein LOC118503345 n=1 Tax=Anopheles stephensi TaxID=30069 RepID=UPI0016588AA9|nr:uncharacterized protein LOC118503345 [Anopheles stephensi]
MAIAYYDEDEDEMSHTDSTFTGYDDDQLVPLALDPPTHNFFQRYSPAMDDLHVAIANLLRVLARVVILYIVARVMLYGSHRAEMVMCFVVVVVFYRYYIIHLINNVFHPGEDVNRGSNIINAEAPTEFFYKVPDLA